MKKQLILTIDEEIIEKAKKQIPNISGLVEECLKTYLGIGNNLVNTSNIHELNETISKCQVQLHIINKRQDTEEAQAKAKQEEINLAWRQAYNEYRDTQKINPEKLQNASEKLKIHQDTLTDIIETCYVFHEDDEINPNNWSEVKKQYG